MRRGEFTLVVANLVAFGGLTVPLPDTMSRIGSVTVIALLIAIVQSIWEGARWQLVPSYVLSRLLFVIWLVQSTALAGVPSNPTIAGMAIGVGILVMALSVVLPIISPVFRFARPNGPHAIGTLTYHWVDDARSEVFTSDPGDHRELMVQIWYPARPPRTAARAPYVRKVRALAPGLAGLARQNAERLFPRFPFPVPSSPSLTWNTSRRTPSPRRRWPRTSPTIRC